MPSCERPNIDQDGDDGTVLLRDRDVTSCVNAFPEDEDVTSVTARVLNPLAGNRLPGPIIKVFGKNIDCNPVTSMNVKIAPTCEESGHCADMTQCVAHVMKSKFGLDFCQYSCKQYRGSWEYALITLIQNSNVVLCEVFIEY